MSGMRYGVDLYTGEVDFYWSFSDSDESGSQGLSFGMPNNSEGSGVMYDLGRARDFVLFMTVAVIAAAISRAVLFWIFKGAWTMRPRSGIKALVSWTGIATSTFLGIAGMHYLTFYEFSNLGKEWEKVTVSWNDYGILAWIWNLGWRGAEFLYLLVILAFIVACILATCVALLRLTEAMRALAFTSRAIAIVSASTSMLILLTAGMPAICYAFEFTVAYCDQYSPNLGVMLTFYPLMFGWVSFFVAGFMSIALLIGDTTHSIATAVEATHWRVICSVAIPALFVGPAIWVLPQVLPDGEILSLTARNLSSLVTQTLMPHSLPTSPEGAWNAVHQTTVNGFALLSEGCLGFTIATVPLAFLSILWPFPTNQK